MRTLLGLGKNWLKKIKKARLAFYITNFKVKKIPQIYIIERAIIK